MKTSYKQMLRDRMPKMLDLALRYCKAKQRWIDYVYDTILRKHSVGKRANVVKTVLGIKQKYKRQEIYDKIRYVELKNITKNDVNNIPKSKLFMTFADTIDWEELSCRNPHMYEYWKIIAGWVNWFSVNYISIESTYDYCKSWKMNNEEIIPILMEKYEIDYKLAEFLIKSFK